MKYTHYCLKINFSEQGYIGDKKVTVKKLTMLQKIPVSKE